jgi:hypothetical protein
MRSAILLTVDSEELKQWIASCVRSLNAESLASEGRHPKRWVTSKFALRCCKESGERRLSSSRQLFSVAQASQRFDHVHAVRMCEVRILQETSTRISVTHQSFVKGFM